MWRSSRPPPKSRPAAALGARSPGLFGRYIWSFPGSWGGVVAVVLGAVEVAVAVVVAVVVLVVVVVVVAVAVMVVVRG